MCFLVDRCIVRFRFELALSRLTKWRLPFPLSATTPSQVCSTAPTEHILRTTHSVPLTETVRRGRWIREQVLFHWTALCYRRPARIQQFPRRPRNYLADLRAVRPQRWIPYRSPCDYWIGMPGCL